MAIPSGSGTEVLKRLTHNVLNGGTGSSTVPAHHIWTILSINISSNASAVSNFGITIHDGSNDINIMAQNSGGLRIPAYETYVHDTKMVLTAGDTLKIAFSGDYAEVYVSYIDQDWS